MITAAEQEVIDALRREVGPTRGHDGDALGGWQPMIAAREVWALLDLIEREVEP